MSRIASIDIGTNTILMLVADINTKDFSVVNQYFSIPRLGEGVDKTSLISEDSLQRASEILKNYYDECQKSNVHKILAVGTSALRDATNSKEIKNIFENILDSEIRIITGEEEAYLSFIGSVDLNNDSLLIDIGGGSTEIIHGHNDKIFFRESLQIGAVRITERIFERKYPIAKDKTESAKELIISHLSKVNFQKFPENFYSVAGTPCAIATALNGLFDYEVEKIDGKEIFQKDINKIVHNFMELTPAEITSHYMINPKRADLIAAGGLILNTILEYWGIEKVIVSAKGLRYGIIKDYIIKTNQ